MAKEDEKLIIEIELDDGKLVKGFINAKKVSGKEGRKAGKKFGDDANAAASKGLSSLKKTVLGIGAALVGAFAFREVITAAQAQEDAVNQLDASLRNLGQYTPELSSELQRYAAELQSVTTFGDEAIISQLAFAQAMGANVTQSKQILTAAADMSAALNIDLNSAVRNISKTLGGFAGELGEVIPELKSLTAEQLKAGEGVTLLARKYSGFANAQVSTFSGAMKQLKNTFGDFLEEIGFFITKSPVMIATFRILAEEIGKSSKNMKELTTQDALLNFGNLVIDVGRAINTYMIAPLEILYNMGEFVFNALRFGVQALIKTFTDIAGKIADALALAKIENRYTATLQTLREASNEVFTGIAEDTKKSFNDIFDVSMAQKADEVLLRIQDTAEKISAESARISSEPVNLPPVGEDNLSYTFSNIFDGIKSEMTSFKSSVADFSKRIGQSLQQGIGAGAANAFAAFGKAAAEGENMLKAFLNSFLGSMGQMAIQLGAMFILEGAAMTFAGLPNGPALIAAGAALAAFGGVMGALFGGESAGGGGGSGIAVASPGTNPGNPIYTDPTTGATRDNERESSPTINVNIQGDILDSQESGRRIVDIINSAFDKEGLKIRRGAVV